MADYQLRARIPNELAEEVKNIADVIQEENPGAEATISTISRFALKDYVKRYNSKRGNTALFLELNTVLPNEDIDKLIEHLIAIRGIYQNVDNSIQEVFTKQIEELTKAILNLVEKSEKKREDYNEYWQNILNTSDSEKGGE